VVFSADDGRADHLPAGDLGRVVARASERAAHQNVYVGVGLQDRDAVLARALLLERQRAEREDRTPRPVSLRYRRGWACTVLALPGLFLDLDLGTRGHVAPNLPADEAQARGALEADFPLPPSLYVHSGHGLYGWWLFKEPWVFGGEDERDEAQALLRRFRATLTARWQARGWRLDPVAELARVLRPVGTVNRKPGLPPVPVRLLPGGSGARYAPSDFEPHLLDDDHAPAVWDGYDADTDDTPARLQPIVAGCAFVRHVRDDAEGLCEPDWYAGLSILARCEGGRATAHAWSRPDPRYSEAGTEAKLEHALTGAGPRTCAHIRVHLGFAGCDGCPHRGAVKSPIVLGRPEPAGTVEQKADGTLVRRLPEPRRPRGISLPPPVRPAGVPLPAPERPRGVPLSHGVTEEVRS
jgi:hypothetical protein